MFYRDCIRINSIPLFPLRTSQTELESRQGSSKIAFCWASADSHFPTYWSWSLSGSEPHATKTDKRASFEATVLFLLLLLLILQ